MNNNIYGYIRVSSKDQNEARQLAALGGYCIPPGNLFIDKQSGKDFDRPNYKRLMKKLKAGDLLIVKSIDRLGRDYGEILEQWRIITKERGADILIVDMPLLDTRTEGRDLTGTFIADLVLQILSYVAEVERGNIRQRQAEGIAAARARGVSFGRPKKSLPGDFPLWYADWKAGRMTVNELAAKCGMSRPTLYKHMAEYAAIHLSEKPGTP